MSTPTNVFLNWQPITIVATPLTGSPVTVTLTGILDVDPDLQTQQEKVYGDALKFPRLILSTQKTRGLTITALDIARVLSIPEDSTCVVTVTLGDAKNGTAAGGGGLSMVLSNAVRQMVDFKSPNNKAGSGSVKFEAYGNTGDTDPFVVTAL
jgi:hypothetical protein